MSWQPYVMIAFAILVLGALVGLLAIGQFDAGLVRGAAIGLVLGAGLMAFSGITTARALKDKSRAGAVGQVLGGLFLRVVILLVGFVVLAFTGIASPASFVLAFLAGVMLMLGWQVVRTVRRLNQTTPQPA